MDTLAHDLGIEFKTSRQRPGHGHTTVRIPRHLVIHLPNSGSIPIHLKNIKNNYTHTPTPTTTIHQISGTGIPHGKIIFPGSIPLGAKTSIISNIPNNASPRGQHPQGDHLHSTNGHNRPPLTLHFEHIPAQLTGGVQTPNHLPILPHITI